MDALFFISDGARSWGGKNEGGAGGQGFGDGGWRWGGGCGKGGVGVNREERERAKGDNGWLVSYPPPLDPRKLVNQFMYIQR